MNKTQGMRICNTWRMKSSLVKSSSNPLITSKEEEKWPFLVFKEWNLSKQGEHAPSPFSKD